MTAGEDGVIYPGDLLIVREEKAYTPKERDVVVVAFGTDDAAAKVVKRKSGRLCYCPDSGLQGEYGQPYREYPATEGQVFGVVEFVLHDPKFYPHMLMAEAVKDLICAKEI